MQIAQHTHRHTHTQTVTYISMKLLILIAGKSRKNRQMKCHLFLCLCRLALDIVLGVLVTHTHTHTHPHTCADNPHLPIAVPVQHRSQLHLSHKARDICRVITIPSSWAIYRCDLKPQLLMLLMLQLHLPLNKRKAAKIERKKKEPNCGKLKTSHSQLEETKAQKPLQSKSRKQKTQRGNETANRSGNEKWNEKEENCELTASQSGEYTH